MAGLSAAACARELGATPLVYEKGTRPGGSMRSPAGATHVRVVDGREEGRIGTRRGFAHDRLLTGLWECA